MATIDQLNFKVIIDDAEFNKKVQSIEAAAQSLNTSLSKLLDLQKQVGGVRGTGAASQTKANASAAQAASQAAIAQERLNKAQLQTQQAAAKLAAEEQKVAAATSKAEAAASRAAIEHERLVKAQTSRLSSAMQNLKGLFATYFSAVAAVNLVKSLVRITSEFELQQVALSAIINDAQRAEAIFGQIQGLAIKSPFSVLELTSYTKQLSAFSVPTDELYDTVKMLADVSAGLGVGMDRLILAYGQIRSASFLRGQEVRQLTEAGVPILENLRQKFVELGEEGITVGDVLEKISNRLVPFEMIKEVFQDMTSEGGKFYNMQEIQAESLKGKISNLKDAYQIMFAEIGDKSGGFLKGSVDMARDLALNYEKVGAALLSVVSAVGAYKAVALALRAASAYKSLARDANNVRGAALAWKALTQESKAFAAVQKTISSLNPFAFIAAAVAGLTIYFAKLASDTARFKKELNEIADSKYNVATSSVETLHQLSEKLKSATVGSENYRDAISQLNRQYGEYLPNLLNEKNALDEIGRAEDEVAGKIMARQKIYALEQGTQKIEDKYGKDVSKYLDMLANALVSDESIASDAANRFVAKLREDIEKAMASGGKIPDLSESLSSFFGEKIKVGGMSYSAAYYADLVMYIEKIADARKRLENQINMRWGAGGYSTEAEYQATHQLTVDYEAEVADIKNQQLDADKADTLLLSAQLGYLERMKQAYKDLASDGSGNANEWLLKVDEIQKKIDGLQPKEATWLQSIVNPLITNKESSVYKVKETDSYTDYVEALKKEYQTATANLTNIIKTDDAQTEEAIKSGTARERGLWETRKQTLEEIAKALGLTAEDLAGTKKTRAAATNSGKSDAQKDIESQIALIKEVWEWDKKLTALDKATNTGSNQGLLKKYFPTAEDVIDSRNYEETIASLIEELKKFDAYAAERETRSLSGKGIGTEYQELQNQQRAIQEYEEYIKKLDEALGLEGEDKISVKLSNIITRYNAAAKKARESRDAALKNLGDTGTYNSIEKEGPIEALWAQETDNAAKEATQAMKALADDWVNAQKKLGGALDIQSLGQMTAVELRKVKKACEEFKKSDVLADIPQEVKDQVRDAGLSLGDLETAIMEALDNLSKKADNKLFDKVMKNAARSVSAVASCLDSLGTLADTTGSTALKIISNLGEQLSMLQGVLQSVAQGDWVSASLQLVTNMVNSIISAVNKAEQLKNNIASAKAELSSINSEARLTEGTETIFGTDKSRQFTQSLKEASEAYKRATEDAKKYREEMKGGQDDDTMGAATAIGTAAGAAIGALFGPIGILIGALSGALAGAVTDSVTAANNYKTTLQEMADAVGGELFDSDYDNAIYNTDTLDAILNAYEDLSAADRAFIEQAKANAEQYKNAWESVYEVMSDIFSSIQNDVASTMISAFKETGKAALDYADAIDSVATSLANMVVQGVVAQYLTEEFQKELTNEIAEGNYGEAMQMVTDKLDEFNTEAGPYIQDLLEEFEKFFTTGEESTSLSSDISGITENTASLLASYLNAIRSDVAYTKGTITQIEQELRTILASGTQAPNIVLYLQKLTANTQSIMLDIQSMMTNEGGATALRTYKS